MQRIADPEIPGGFRKEGPAFGDPVPSRTGGEAGHGEQSMHGGAMEPPRVHHAGALEHPDDAADRAPGPLAFDAEDRLGDRRVDHAAAPAIRAVPRKERVKPAVAVGVIPRLQRAR